MKHCKACGMPLEKKEDFAKGDTSADFCLHCTDADGTVKSVEEIFEGGVQFFMNSIESDRSMAERITRKNMLSLLYWQENNSDVLKGEVATDQEFSEVLKKL
jgi:hypothetical protein